MNIARAYRLDVTRLAADYSQDIREHLTADQLANVRNGDAVAADYTDTGEAMAQAVALQVPGFASLADYADEMREAEERATASGFRLSRILVACEYSGTVRDAFAACGHSAESCDILPSESPGGIHHQRDARELLGDGYHLMIAHPPCTYIAACQLWRCQPKHDPSGQREAKRQEALQLVRDFAGAPIERKVIENPKSCIGTENAAPGFIPQMIQPYQFGHDHSKQTYLWRTPNLPELEANPADYVAPRDAVSNSGKPCKRWANQCDGSGADRMGPSADRGHKRSAFFSGIARALAEQYGGIATRPAATVTPITAGAQLALAF